MRDKLCLGITSRNPNMLIPWILMASYGYYFLDRPLISDGLYDTLCKEAMLKWDEINHVHKQCFTKDHLIAGSLYTLKERDYPHLVKDATAYLLQE